MLRDFARSRNFGSAHFHQTFYKLWAFGLAEEKLRPGLLRQMSYHYFRPLYELAIWILVIFEETPSEFDDLFRPLTAPDWTYCCRMINPFESHR